MEGGEQDPGEKLRREAFERSAEDDAITTRLLISERGWNPSEGEIREVLELITSEVLDPTLKQYASVDTLKKFKEVVSKTYGYPSSTSRLSATVINAVAAKLNDAAIEEFKNNELSLIAIQSICVYDVSVGIMKVVSPIEDAEDAIRGTFDKQFGHIYNEYLAGTLSLPDEADFFLAEKAKALKYSKLLKEDPNGKSLIRHAVKEIENQKEFDPYLREFVLHGARFAETAYGIIYPLAEKIIKPT